MRTQRIKDHFEKEAYKFDEIILNLIPNYQQMIDVLVSLLPFEKEQSFSVIDLGCGTGTISRQIKDNFPGIQLTCVDLSEKMLHVAAAKNGADTIIIEADFNTFEFPAKYDAIVSSLALHHLETDADKQKFYDKIFGALNDGGIFINIDIVEGDGADLREMYLQKWIEFMEQNVPPEEVENRWLPVYYEEDSPVPLRRHLEMLKKSGFPVIDVAYKYYNYAVYCARK